jgi:hypothetical protein
VTQNGVQDCRFGYFGYFGIQNGVQDYILRRLGAILCQGVPGEAQGA